MFNNKTNLDVRGTQLSEAKHKGAKHVVCIVVNGETEQYYSPKVSFTTEGYVVFETTCSKYIKHCGDYTVYEISRNASK